MRDLNSLLVDQVGGRRPGAVAAARGSSLDADFLWLVGPTVDACEQLLLDVLGELETDWIVFVSELVADVARIGPGRLGPRLGRPSMVVGVAVVEGVVAL